MVSKFQKIKKFQKNLNFLKFQRFKKYSEIRGATSISDAFFIFLFGGVETVCGLHHLVHLMKYSLHVQG